VNRFVPRLRRVENVAEQRARGRGRRKRSAGAPFLGRDAHDGCRHAVERCIGTHVGRDFRQCFGIDDVRREAVSALRPRSVTV